MRGYGLVLNTSNNQNLPFNSYVRAWEYINRKHEINMYIVEETPDSLKLQFIKLKKYVDKLIKRIGTYAVAKHYEKYDAEKHILDRSIESTILHLQDVQVNIQDIKDRYEEMTGEFIEGENE